MRAPTRKSVALLPRPTVHNGAGLVVEACSLGVWRRTCCPLRKPARLQASPRCSLGTGSPSPRVACNKRGAICPNRQGSLEVSWATQASPTSAGGSDSKRKDMQPERQPLFLCVGAVSTASDTPHEHIKTNKHATPSRGGPPQSATARVRDRVVPSWREVLRACLFDRPRKARCPARRAGARATRLPAKIAARPIPRRSSVAADVRAPIENETRYAHAPQARGPVVDGR